MKAKLLLNNGMIFEGASIGAEGTFYGEIIFDTSMETIIVLIVTAADFVDCNVDRAAVRIINTTVIIAVHQTARGILADVCIAVQRTVFAVVDDRDRRDGIRRLRRQNQSDRHQGKAKNEGNHSFHDVFHKITSKVIW